MRWLIDTHIALWVLYEPKKLNSITRNLLSSDDADPVFSVVSIWEIAIKVSNGKLAADAAVVRATLLKSGFEELSILGQHAERLATLPKIHGDPFDRMLIAQAMEEPMRLLTADRKLQPYSELVTLI